MLQHYIGVWFVHCLLIHSVEINGNWHFQHWVSATLMFQSTSVSGLCMSLASFFIISNSNVLMYLHVWYDYGHFEAIEPLSYVL